MNVKLEIKNDAELRNYIKDMIRGQVLSVVREQTRDVFNSLVNKNADSVVKGIIRDEVNSIIKNHRYYLEGQLKEMARKEINATIKQMISNGNIV